jgi:Asp-tRNA(Asn)/Glu-tRNA(Gln) amidotransferase C subunit
MPKKFSLLPVEIELKQILAKLKAEAKLKLTPKQKQQLAKDIKKLTKLIKTIPPVCKGNVPTYNLGI